MGSSIEGSSESSTLLSRPSMGLDVDGVLANFGQGIIEAAKIMDIDIGLDNWAEQTTWMPPEADGFQEVWDVVSRDPEFWLGLKPFEEYPNYTPGAYVTSRPISSDVTRKWLETFGFPSAPVITVSSAFGKVKPCHELGLLYFIDDKPENWLVLREHGVHAYLLDRPWNRYVNTHDRIFSVNEV